jgi:hypothetical protein
MSFGFLLRAGIVLEVVPPIAEMLFNRMELGLPDNIDEISKNEMLEVLEHMAQYEATTLGLKRLRKQFLRGSLPES